MVDGMQLRDYQERVIHELRDGFRAGHRRQILALATGSGKTVVAAHLIRNAAAKGHKSLFVVDRIELVDQAASHLHKIGLKVGIMQGENTAY
jgi:superfamily II DNA or RNA helicase